jgi:polar amino acid transport system substrate-binding protein
MELDRPRRLPARRLALAVLLALMACDLPRDNEGTLERVRGGELRVGVAQHPPWVRIEGERVAGIEPALIEEWAQSLGSRVRWVRGSEAELVEALERREIDILAAGLTEKTPYAPRMGVTQPFLETELRLGAPPGGAEPDDWSGQRVAVDPHRPALAGRVRERGAEPVPAGEPDEPSLPRAAYDFELAGRGFRPVGRKLASEKRVMAVIPGESALLLELDRYLLGLGEDEIRRRAARQAAR